jgi:hypothetical protein
LFFRGDRNRTSDLPLHIPRTLAEKPLLEKRPGWYELRAVREDIADGNQYFNRLGHPGALPTAAPRHRLGGLAAGVALLKHRVEQALAKPF